MTTNSETMKAHSEYRRSATSSFMMSRALIRRGICCIPLMIDICSAMKMNGI